mmetsp:Transcript_6657/g.10703  ORF Transcript_6657/g.10703 Transcript_6657/m.10703 type:complete len:87 (+) Transcript_6657:119-379(+)|eukprot:CAMPEP_0170490388 /NCGR_PEP_ID=MMETSP0208-20121228/8581_1 /TAXON_ID=197538 /ORGANISM="Strombidium inclinatum, Strain S3" /LENGTH=86 /DNA_ID=CAMNT_0010765729 /DNA_START=97 /DNA_END=357 /DNA_ORIENTATION=+
MNLAVCGTPGDYSLLNLNQIQADQASTIRAPYQIPEWQWPAGVKPPTQQQQATQAQPVRTPYQIPKWNWPAGVTPPAQATPSFGLL